MTTDIQSLPKASPLELYHLALVQGIDPDKIGKLLDLQERVDRNKAAEAFAFAIQDFQREMPAIIKANDVRKRGDNGKQGELLYQFADYDDILEIAQPIMSRLGIVPTFSIKLEAGMFITTCRIRVGNHFEETTVPLGLPQIPNANDSQKAGAALSYGKRYALCAALNIRVKGEDRDACGLDPGLSHEQTMTLNGLFKDCREAGNPVDSERFYKWIGCEDMNDMKAKDFQRAVSELQRKKGAKSKTAG